ncbi:hypothetical protein B5K08_27975 [Rhizobium leguminosarum bv. trifolii]|uniref:Uncharacterized protein n=1 Tax=Rhizobium leguminosarum bv. trifolii TaxID=386 RepID=A0A3E1B254_RHILT|nr:hypothetical protein B5K08_27975 [Rhizobium leguminosarum bv. trifolii]RFB84401.1 hypothetical protein B5K10_27965 [Rhizobium leguminosarum bv. trifolii]
MRGGLSFRDPWRCFLCDCGVENAGGVVEKTLTRKQTNVQYFEFFRFHAEREFLTCIFCY